MMSTAFIKAALNTFSDSQIDLIVKSGFEAIPLPHRGEIIPFDKSLNSAIRFGKALRSKQYARIYILVPSFSSALMSFIAKIPERIGYAESFRSFLLRPAVEYTQQHRSQHLIGEYLNLLGEDVRIDKVYPQLEATEEWTMEVLSRRFRDLPEDYVSIAPGVIYGPAKQWPENHFRQLVSFFIKRDQTVVIVGTKDDYELGNSIKGAAEGVINLCGKTSLTELIAILAKSKLLVSNDSGTMHVMAALQKPQIAVFGSTSTIWTSPVNEKAEILSLNLDCSPCYKRQCPLGHYRCLIDISPEMVIEKALHLLGGE